MINFYNPKIIEMSCPFKFIGEGCLSIPNTFKDVIRYRKIVIKNGDNSLINLEGFEAVVAQHEIDHFNGILFTDRTIALTKGDL